MEIMSFTLGVLSIIIVAFVAVLVWGIVKVVKQQKQIRNLQEDVERNLNEMYRINSDINNYISTRTLDMERNIYDSIRDLNREIDVKLKEVSESSKSYTDSRIDKLISSNGSRKQVQVIKG